jgi:hypothetical protein
MRAQVENDVQRLLLDLRCYSYDPEPASSVVTAAAIAGLVGARLLFILEEQHGLGSGSSSLYIIVQWRMVSPGMRLASRELGARRGGRLRLAWGGELYKTLHTQPTPVTEYSYAYVRRLY